MNDLKTYIINAFLYRTGQRPTIMGNGYNLSISLGPLNIRIDENPYDTDIIVTVDHSVTNQHYQYYVSQNEVGYTIDYILDMFFQGG